MNHGYCKNCWWWQRLSEVKKETPANHCLNTLRPILQPTYGRCWMQIGDGEFFKLTDEDNYCPDYANRKKEERKNGTLERWLEATEEL
jgi:hypothetical protein